MDKEKKASKLCAKLQVKLITKHKWTNSDRSRWDKLIKIINDERAKKR